MVLSGCAQIEYSVVQLPSGEVLQVFSAQLDNDIIVADGYVIDSIATDVEVGMWAYLLGLNNATYLTKSVDRKVLANGDIIVTAQLKFSSVADYYTYYNIDPDVKPENYVTEKTFFIRKTTQTRKTEFSRAETFDYEILFAGLSTPILNYFTTDDVDYTYSYATYNKKLDSDADRVRYDYSKGVYIHSWDIPNDDLQREIHFYSYSANTTGWYVVALSATALFMLAMYIKIRLKDNKEKILAEKAENLKLDLNI